MHHQHHRDLPPTAGGMKGRLRWGEASVSTNLVEFMITQLGYGNADAANMVTNWNGTVYLLPLLGAYMADAHWGRYVTIIVFSTVYLLVSCLSSAHLLGWPSLSVPSASSL